MFSGLLFLKKTREGWVSRANEGEEASCGCAENSVHEDGQESNIVDIHWDGARHEEPRGTCLGDSHGPQCGHDVRIDHT